MRTAHGLLFGRREGKGPRSANGREMLLNFADMLIAGREKMILDGDPRPINVLPPLGASPTIKINYDAETLTVLAVKVTDGKVHVRVKDQLDKKKTIVEPDEIISYTQAIIDADEPIFDDLILETILWQMFKWAHLNTNIKLDQVRSKFELARLGTQDPLDCSSQRDQSWELLSTLVQIIDDGFVPEVDCDGDSSLSNTWMQIVLPSKNDLGKLYMAQGGGKPYNKLELASAKFDFEEKLQLVVKVVDEDGKQMIVECNNGRWTECPCTTAVELSIEALEHAGLFVK
jgi:hypothetical protein